MNILNRQLSEFPDAASRLDGPPGHQVHTAAVDTRRALTRVHGARVHYLDTFDLYLICFMLHGETTYVVVYKACIIYPNIHFILISYTSSYLAHAVRL